MEGRKLVNDEQGAALVKKLGGEFVVIENPSYVHPPYEVQPLASKVKVPVDRLVAAVMDMDGTTTTTEPLCLHSLETMVRRITNRPTVKEWEGLDKKADYPYIIGNSTTKHVEYLVKTYEKNISRGAFARSLLESALWTLIVGKDLKRREEVRATLVALNWSDLLEDPITRELLGRNCFDKSESKVEVEKLLKKHKSALQLESFTQRVRAAVDIYYCRYHEILSAIAEGRGQELSAELLGGRRLVEPMPGVAFFLSLIKGWLGKDAGKLHDVLVEQANPEFRRTAPKNEEAIARLTKLGEYFHRNPLAVGLVTSSIKYEADIVLNEIFSILREQISTWPVRSDLAERFNNPAEFYDAYITASDSSEIRLKPHRDLYSIALHAMGLAREDLGAVVGFEDSESGTIAIRAAGIGLCVALPFADTHGHDFDAATFTLFGGLPQAVLEHNLFIKP